MIWITDIVRIPEHRRGPMEWSRLGAHHAQALVARRARELGGAWFSYANAVVAAARHEQNRLEVTSETYYWRSYANHVSLAVAVEEAERNFLPVRIVASR